MLWTYNRWIGLLGICLLSVSCDTDEDAVFVNDEFDYYFQRFEEAATARGVEVDISDLTAHISLISEQNVAGVCETAASGERTIRVDDQFWFQGDEWDREFVIFHELGHCVLGRGHIDEQDAQGNCISIMQSGLTECNMPYNADTREAYLDELFQ